MDKADGTPLQTLNEGEISPAFSSGLFSYDAASGDEDAETAKPTRKISLETPLIRAIRRGSYLRYFLTKDFDLNELLQTYQHQRSAFHFAINRPGTLKALLRYCEKHPAVHEVLLQEDMKGQTPIHRAAVLGDTRCLEILHEYDHALIKLQSSLRRRSVLHFAVKSSSTFTVQFVLNEDPGQINMADSMSRTPAHYAAKLKRKDILVLLISMGVDVTIKDIIGRLPIHTAASEGLLDIVELLVEDELGCINSVDGLGQTPLMVAAKNGFPEIVTYLLKEKANFIQTDVNSRSAFDLAILHEKSEVVEVFLNHSDWQKIITESDLGPKNCLTVLIKSMPDTSLVLLNKCIKVKGTNEYPEILYDFICFQKGSKNERKQKDNISTYEALGVIIELKREKCLSHPLFVKYVNMKWQQRGFKYNLVAIVLALVFHACFMTYIMALNEIFAPNNGTSTRGRNLSEVAGVAGIRPENNKMWTIRIIMLFLIFVSMLKELFQVMIQRSHYFYYTKHYMQWTMFITVLIYLLPLNNVITRTQLGFGSVSIFLSWFTLIQFLRMVPVLGVYLLAVERVFWTVIKVFAVVFLYILGFASTFYVLEEWEKYQNFGDALVYTFVAMMWGSDDLLMAESETFPELHDLKLFVLVIFIIVMSIVVNNTLIGLAVGDTDEVMKSAKVKKFRHKACIVYYLEKSVSHLPGFYIKEDPSVSEFPMQKKSNLQTILEFVYHGGQPVNTMDMVDGLSKQEDVVDHANELAQEDIFEQLLTFKIEKLRTELMETLDKHTEAIDKILEKLS